MILLQQKTTVARQALHGGSAAERRWPSVLIASSEAKLLTGMSGAMCLLRRNAGPVCQVLSERFCASTDQVARSAGLICDGV